MLSSPELVKDFVDNQVLESDSSNELDILFLESAYSELARLKNMKDTVNSLPENNDKSTRLINSLSNTVKDSEENANKVLGIVGLETSDIKTAYSKSKEFVVSALTNEEKAAVNLALTEGDVDLQEGFKIIKRRASQINPLNLRDLANSTADSIGLRLPLLQRSSRSVEQLEGTTEPERNVLSFLSDVISFAASKASEQYIALMELEEKLSDFTTGKIGSILKMKETRTIKSLIKQGYEGLSSYTPRDPLINNTVESLLGDDAEAAENSLKNTLTQVFSSTKSDKTEFILALSDPESSYVETQEPGDVDV